MKTKMKPRLIDKVLKRALENKELIKLQIEFYKCQLGENSEKFNADNLVALEKKLITEEKWLNFLKNLKKTGGMAEMDNKR